MNYAKAYVVDSNTLALRIETGDITRDGGVVAYTEREGDAIKDGVVWRDGSAWGTLIHTPDGAAFVSVFDTYAASPLQPFFDALRAGGVIDPAQFLSVTGPDAVAITGISFKSKIVDTARLSNTTQEFVVQNEIFLHFDAPIAANADYAVTLSPGFVPPVTATLNTATSVSEVLHVTHAGFDPGDPVKKAYASAYLGQDLQGESSLSADIGVGTAFRVVDVDSGQTVHTGAVALSSARTDITGRSTNYDKTDVYVMDFSQVTDPGVYRVEIDGIGQSHDFRIADTVWADAARVALEGFYVQRSGIEIDAALTGGYAQPRSMHPDDGFVAVLSTATLMDTSMGLNLQGISSFDALKAGATTQVIDGAWGGWHDAADFDRRVQHLSAARDLLDIADRNAAFAEDFRLNVPEADNGIPDVIDEAMWAIDLWSRLQFAHGGVSGGIESESHPQKGETSYTDSLKAYVYAPDAWSSFEYAATAAKAARLLAPYDAVRAADLTARAERAMDWAEANNPAHAALVPEVINARNLAAVELYRLTGDAAYHQTFVATSSYAETGLPAWNEHQFEAVMSYAKADGALNPDLLQRGIDTILLHADRLLEDDRGSYGQAIDPKKPLGYGNTSAVPNESAHVLVRAHVLTGDEKYLKAIIDDTQFGLGANPDNLSFTTGIGPNTPRDPLIVNAVLQGGEAPDGITVFGNWDVTQRGWHYSLNLLQDQVFPLFQELPVHETYMGFFRSVPVAEFAMKSTIAPVATVWSHLAAYHYTLDGGFPSEPEPLPVPEPPSESKIAPLPLAEPLRLTGTGGADTLAGGVGNDLLWGYGGNDLLNGLDGNDRLDGGAGNDSLQGDAGNDELHGGAGSDTLAGGAGDDLMVGGAGADHFLFDSADGVGADAIRDFSRADGDRLVFEGITSDAVTLTRDAADLLAQWGGASVRLASYFTRNADQIDSLTLKDIAIVADPPPPAPDLSAARVMTGTGLGDHMEGAGGDDRLSGYGGNDVLTGHGGNDRLDGGAGHDSLEGGAGNDAVHGGVGNDTLAGGPGNDLLVGGAGADVFVFRKSDGAQDSVIRDFSLVDNDSIRFEGFAPGDIGVAWDGTDLVIVWETGSVRLPDVPDMLSDLQGLADQAMAGGLF